MLEVKRPASIIAILERIRVQQSPDVIKTLDVYLSSLETQQLAVDPQQPSQEFDTDNPPNWSHQRGKERASYRRQRTLQKLNRQ